MNVTIVTGLWDLGRGDLNGWAKRDFQQYKDRFFEMLEVDVNMCVWIPSELEEEVKKIRGDKPTRIFIKELKDFETWFPFFDKLQEIRTNPEWYNSAGWLPESPQASLKYYNPMMMCKMFMLNDSAITNPFDTDYFFWIDGGLTSTVHKGYFQHDKVFDNLEHHCELTNKFTFIQYPYEGSNEIHGFDRLKMAEYCETDYVNRISRGGFFGGSKKLVHEINNLYYGILHDTMHSGLMGADECLFTILSYRHKDLIENFEIESNGLVWPFFEYLKDVKKKFETTVEGKKLWSKIKTNLYVLTFNFPEQFEKLCQSFMASDNNFLSKTDKYLINNSTDSSTFEQYEKLCDKYKFIEIRKDNIGICGGRQFCAEHFDQSDADYYIFFEDDMFLHAPMKLSRCKNGMTTYVTNLYEKSLKIMYDTGMDYLKLSFSELYGDCSEQWAWYNVPMEVRKKYFPNKTKLPAKGLDANPPKTRFFEMGKQDDLKYMTGEVHYCNWPLWFSREGNKKIFLDVKWDHPYEQTWMSQTFQLQKKGEILAGVLLASPINHTRIHYYKPEERREN